MTPKFICGGTKYEVGGSKHDVIGLPVVVTDVPDSIHIQENTLSLKDAFHVSLVCIGKIIEKEKITDPDFTAKVINDFCSFTKDNPIDFARYRDEFRFVESAERKSAVLMCDVKNLEAFFDQLNARYGMDLEYPPTHVTLYTLQPNAGIFLTDSKEVSTLSKIVATPAQLEKLL